VISRVSWCLFLAAALSHLTLAPAQAYLDPSMGSFIVQAIAGTLLAGGLILKRYWHWFKHKLLRPGGKGDQELDEQ